VCERCDVRISGSLIDARRNQLTGSGGGDDTEVQRVSFVSSTNEDCHPHPLCNLQNLYAVPPYALVDGSACADAVVCKDKV